MARTTSVPRGRAPAPAPGGESGRSSDPGRVWAVILLAGLGWLAWAGQLDAQAPHEPFGTPVPSAEAPAAPAEILFGAAHSSPAAGRSLPESLPEKLLILSDNRFLPDGSLDFPDPESEQGKIDERNGREGDVLFVNGQTLPRVTIWTGEVQRWRVINASGARIYRLALSGHTFLHVGSDGGLFERPVEVDEIVLANGERAELLVRGTGAPGSRRASDPSSQFSRPSLPPSVSACIHSTTA